MALLSTTTIAKPDQGEALVEELVAGSLVAAATLEPADTPKPAWAKAKVAASFDSGEGEHVVIWIVIGMDDVLMCTRTQPLLLSDGKLIRAGNLRPGLHLVGRDGKPMEATTVSVMSYEGTVGAFTLEPAWGGDVGGHLVLASNVVVGDYLVELHFDELPEDKVHGPSDPVLTQR